MRDAQRREDRPQTQPETRHDGVTSAADTLRHPGNLRKIHIVDSFPCFRVSVPHSHIAVPVPSTVPYTLQHRSFSSVPSVTLLFIHAPWLPSAGFLARRRVSLASQARGIIGLMPAYPGARALRGAVLLLALQGGRGQVLAPLADSRTITLGPRTVQAYWTPAGSCVCP